MCVCVCVCACSYLRLMHRQTDKTDRYSDGWIQPEFSEMLGRFFKFE